MNFTTDIKREIIQKGIQGDRPQKAALAAFVKTSAIVGERDGKPAFFIVSETEKVAEFFTDVFERVFLENLTVSRALMDKKRGRGRLILEYVGNHIDSVADELFMQSGRTYSFERDDERLAYIKGCFLGGGSCILPSEDTQNSTGYHLEFVFSEEIAAEHFCDTLMEFELLAKTVKRGGSFVAYIKSKETISDFLSVVGATSCLHKFTELVEKRDEANRFNRAANCFSGNADKQAQASVKQVMSIRLLKEKGDLEKIDGALKETATLRLENPTLSLNELSEKTGLSKSCLNHRIRKLMSLAEKIKE